MYLPNNLFIRNPDPNIKLSTIIRNKNPKNFRLQAFSI